MVVHKHWIKAIITIRKLNDSFIARPNCVVVLHYEVFQSLHQPALHVACLGSFDGCVDESLATTNGMEEEFCGRESVVKAVLDKTLGCRVLGVRLKVRQ